MSPPTTIARRLVGLNAAWLATACSAMPVELDPQFKKSELACDGVACTDLPRCADGGTHCQACSCCACAEGTTLCDPTTWNHRWVCRDGCFVDEPCPIGAGCFVTTAQGAICDGTQFECARIHPYDLILVCDQTEALCAACGPCLSCTDLGETSVCDFRPSGDANTLLSCDVGASCVTASPCATGTECLYGYATGVSICGTLNNCDSVGCTGFPVCDQPESLCGTCGCCAISLAPDGACGLTPDGLDARYQLNAERTCYEAYPCNNGSLCTYDSYDRPVCVSR